MLFNCDLFKPNCCLSESCTTPQNVYLDVVGIGEEHGETIDAHAPARRRRQPVLQRCAEGLVNEHGFIVTLSFGLNRVQHESYTLQQRMFSAIQKNQYMFHSHRCLLLKKLPLSHWIIQLSVRIADFLLHHKELKTLSEAFL